jgi:hypothetical protein
VLSAENMMLSDNRLSTVKIVLSDNLILSADKIMLSDNMVPVSNNNMLSVNMLSDNIMPSDYMYHIFFLKNPHTDWRDFGR